MVVAGNDGSGRERELNPATASRLGSMLQVKASEGSENEDDDRHDWSHCHCHCHSGLDLRLHGNFRARALVLNLRFDGLRGFSRAAEICMRMRPSSWSSQRYLITPLSVLAGTEPQRTVVAVQSSSASAESEGFVLGRLELEVSDLVRRVVL